VKRTSTLTKRCVLLDCQPGDLLAYDPDPADFAAAEGDGEG
jgi:putative transcriptional regulator